MTWIKIYETGAEHRATMAKDILLDSAGIAAVVINKKASPYNNFGLYEVHVAENTRIEAQEILKEYGHIFEP